jgi:hypothetical protein
MVRQMPDAVVEERCDAPSPGGGALQLSTAVYRQMNKEKPRTHHDALEFPEGQTVLLLERQEATVLQFPTQPVAAEAGGPGFVPQPETVLAEWTSGFEVQLRPGSAPPTAGFFFSMADVVDAGQDMERNAPTFVIQVTPWPLQSRVSLMGGCCLASARKPQHSRRLLRRCRPGIRDARSKPPLFDGVPIVSRSRLCLLADEIVT